MCVNGDDIAPNALSSKNSIQSTNSDDSHTRHATNEYVLVSPFSFALRVTFRFQCGPSSISYPTEHHLMV